MAANETLTHEGLVYTLMMDIARREKKYAVGGWNGDREYILGLAREVTEALNESGRKPVNAAPAAPAKTARR